MSNSVFFLGAAFVSSVVLGSLVVLLSRPRRPKNSFGDFASRLEALAQTTAHTTRPSDGRYQTGGVTLLSDPANEQPQRSDERGRSSSGS